jgi:hypothetical protein
MSFTNKLEHFKVWYLLKQLEPKLKWLRLLIYDKFGKGPADAEKIFSGLTNVKSR